MEIIPRGSVIGILGDGQLGRMTIKAATDLGFRCHVFGTIPDSPAAQVCADATLSVSYTDAAKLARFASAVDVITCEFENVPAEAFHILSQFTVPVRPGGEAFSIASDRIKEKTFLHSIGVPTTPWRAVTGYQEVQEALAVFGEVIMKTVRMGYDGKGQMRFDNAVDAMAAWKTLNQDTAIAEAVVDFDREISVIVARGLDGKMAVYPAVENLHKNGILIQTTAPAPRLAPTLAFHAESIARTIAERLNIVGLLAVEMFVTRDGEILVNEIAPRPHNSGHWTMDACYCSQFEQLVRAICGLPLGSTDWHHEAVMTNLLGEEVSKYRDILDSDPRLKLHLYGKKDARPGRKMGHVTQLFQKKS